MANTFTNLFGAIYSTVDVVSRELVGFIPSVSRNGEATRLSVGETATVPVSAPTSGIDITPSMTPPTPADKAVGTRTIPITKSRAYPFHITGEEKLGLDAGPGASPIILSELAQAIRGITNEMEGDIAALYKYASRAYGTAGTTPFGSDLTATSYTRKILVDNGAPLEGGWRTVMDSTAGAKMRTLTQLTKANEADDTSMLRQGVLLDIHGSELRESGQIAAHTKGDGSGFVTDLGATLAVGATTIHVDTGTNEVVAGDVVTFAGDTNKYLVTTGHDAGAGATEGDIVIAEPGLQQTLADGVAMTIGDSYTPNVSFTPDAIQLASRLPAQPEGGDAGEHMTVVDPRSGMVYEFSIYRGYRMVGYFVSAAWGVAMTKPEHAAIMLG